VGGWPRWPDPDLRRHGRSGARGLPADTQMQSLGVHRLRDLGEPERIFQVMAPDLPASFPALRTLTKPQHNLPPPTPLIGRAQAVAAVQEHLRRPDVRLL